MTSHENTLYSNERLCKKVKNFLMPRMKQRKQPKGIAVSANEARGSEVQSRIGLDFDKLREAGWTISERQSSSGDKILFRYVRADVSKTQTFSKFRGNSSKINLVHNLMLGRP